MQVETALHPRGWQAAEQEIVRANQKQESEIQLIATPPSIWAPSSNRLFLVLVLSFILGLAIGYVLGRRKKRDEQRPTHTPTLHCTKEQRSRLEASDVGITAHNVDQTDFKAMENPSTSETQISTPADIFHASNGEHDDGAAQDLPQPLLPKTTMADDTPVTSATVILENNDTNQNSSLVNTMPSELEDASQTKLLPELNHPQSTSHTANELAGCEVADITAAGRLVSALMTSVNVNPTDLSASERLQLINTVLQAWQTQEMRKHGEAMQQLGSEANLIRNQQAQIAETHVTHKISKDAHALSLQKTQEFRQTSSDILFTGILLMLAVTLHQALQRGSLQPLINHCGIFPLLASSSRTTSSSSSSRGGGGGTIWGLWTIWRTAEVLICYITGALNAFLGGCFLLSAPWLLYRTGILSDYHSMPVFKLFTGLGIVCGTAGYVAIERLGGAATAWVVCWETWVLMHIGLSAAAHALTKRTIKNITLARTRTQNKSKNKANITSMESSLYTGSHGALIGAMWVLLGGVMPIGTALITFSEAFR